MNKFLVTSIPSQMPSNIPNHDIGPSILSVVMLVVSVLLFLIVALSMPARARQERNFQIARAYAEKVLLKKQVQSPHDDRKSVGQESTQDNTPSLPGDDVK